MRAISRGFESHTLRQRKENFCLPKVLFSLIQAAGLVYHHDARRAVHIIKGGVPPLYLITRQRASTCGLMIYNPCGIDDTLVTNGYITFSAYVFDYACPLMIGVHFNTLRIEFIEIFRPLVTFKATKTEHLSTDKCSVFVFYRNPTWPATL